MDTKKDLVELYESNYLNPTGNQEIVEEKRSKASSDEGVEKSFKKGKSKKKTRMSRKEIGAITYDSFNREDNIFDQILREMDEMNGDEYVDDNVFDSDSAGDVDDMGDEQTFTLTELRGMTLGELADLVSGSGYDYEDEGEEDYAFDDIDEDDEIPAESFENIGNYPGAQGNYDGKAGKLPKSSLVKDNGDAEFGKQNTGYDPDDTEGSEDCEHGAQANYDGKANKLPKSNLVKDNGDADFGKQNTGYRTRSGKKDKNYF